MKCCANCKYYETKEIPHWFSKRYKKYCTKLNYYFGSIKTYRVYIEEESAKICDYYIPAKKQNNKMEEANFRMVKPKSD